MSRPIEYDRDEVLYAATGTFWEQGFRSTSMNDLVASTGFCSIYAWGFNSFGMAFFIMNLFHAVQYLALVWWSEKKNIVRAFSLENLRWKAPCGVAFFLAATTTYGYFVQAVNSSIVSLWAITLVISLMHFWYDGFIWSVRKSHI